MDTLDGISKAYADSRYSTTGAAIVVAGNDILGLPNVPPTDSSAFSKAYADALVAKSGSPITGTLTLSGDPTCDLHAASKAYVEGLITLSSWKYVYYMNVNTPAMTFRR